MANFVDSEHKWATLIGRIFVAFGAIEKLTHECMQEWLNETAYKHLKGSRLARRIDLVIDLVDKESFEEKNTESFIQLLKNAKKLAEKRNIIAHNPLLLALYYGDPDFQEIIQSIKNENDRITFDELEQIAESSEQVANDLIEKKVRMGLEDWSGLPNH